MKWEGHDACVNEQIATNKTLRDKVKKKLVLIFITGLILSLFVGVISEALRLHYILILQPWKEVVIMAILAILAPIVLYYILKL